MIQIPLRYPRSNSALKPFNYSLRGIASAAFALFCLSVAPAKASFVIDSLDGDITQNEINNFVSTIAGRNPATNNWGNNMATHGTEPEGMWRMYDATTNLSVLNNFIRWMDVYVAYRNDMPLGEHRVMWEGTVAPCWPNIAPTDPTPGYSGCENGMIAGDIAQCARCILQTPSIWNTTVPDGNPYGFGVTYHDRALRYLTEVDFYLNNYSTVWFVNPANNRIRKPSDPRWASNAGNQSITAWNRQWLFVMGYLYSAKCHDILGDNPSYLAKYKDIVKQFATWFVATYPSGGGVYYSSGGHSVVKWYYEVPTDQHIENIGHAQHDVFGLFECYASPYSTLTYSQVQPYADTTQYIINLGATNSWAGNVDGTGSGTSLKSDFIFLSQWNRPLYKLIAQSNISANQLNVDEGCKNTAYILYMKRWMFQNTAGGFSLAATPSAQTSFPGSNTTFTVTLTTNTAFTGGVVGFDVTGLPANVTAAFNPASLGTNGNSTLTLTIGAGVALGSYPLTILGTNSAATNTVFATLNITTLTSLFWSGGSLTTDNWSDAANWNGQSLSAGSPLTFSGSTRLDNTNDTAALTSYSNVTFNAGSGSFVLNGNPIVLAGNITNNSSAPQTVNLGMNFNASRVFNGAGSGGLVIAGGLTNTLGAGSTTIQLQGVGTLNNRFGTTASPGGTNVISMNNGAASWTIVDNDTATPMTVPWQFSITNGTLNFGDDDNAPVLNLTAAGAVPTDWEVGRGANGTGTFNMNAGTLTTLSRLNTGTTISGSTGVVNQAGGILNIGNQFQGANIAGGNSIVNLGGGIMNINPTGGSNGVFYVASRGVGVLTVSDDGVLSCGKLDLSRNASGNTSASTGTVNLDGGIVSVQSVTNASANQQTGGSPTATFNFNGGILAAKAGAAARFFQGSIIAPITPIRAYVKAGGANIDDGGNSITFAEPLLHDPSLGGTIDGGLMKLNTGVLTLVSNSTYTGDTIVTAGTLALAGVGSVANSATITVAVAATLDASGRNDGALTLGTGQTLLGNGTLKGNVVIGSGATLAPGNSVGALTFSNNLTLNGGSTTAMELNATLLTNDAANVSGAIQYGGTLALTNLDGTLDVTNSFKLFSAASYSGAFTTITPATPGASLLWNTNTLAVDGTLRIASVVPPSPPYIAAVTLIGGNFILSGSNGSAGMNYYVLSSTNLGLSPNAWPRVATNTFDLLGNFSFTNAIELDTPGRYFMLQIP